VLISVEAEIGEPHESEALAADRRIRIQYVMLCHLPAKGG
jgi:hypothetical protein